MKRFLILISSGIFFLLSCTGMTKNKPKIDISKSADTTAPALWVPWAISRWIWFFLEDSKLSDYSVLKLLMGLAKAAFKA